MRLAHLHLPGITRFSRVSNIQQALTSAHLAHKKALAASRTDNSTLSSAPDPTIITFTPNPVYTTGRRDLPPSNTSSPSDPEPSPDLSLPPSLEPIRDLLTPKPPNSEPQAEYHPTLRGGQTTYHGPGQLVAYTILDLRRMGLSPRCHIRLLENTVIDLVRGPYGVQGFTTNDPGVWVGKDAQTARKIAAVGVHLRRHISSYGVGINVTDEPLWYFRKIVACGLEGREATSLQSEGVDVAARKETIMDEVARGFVEAFVERYRRDHPVGDGTGREGIDEVYQLSLEDVDALQKETASGVV
ncbi:hypothetical protein VTN49DRAFT_1727 [Thermomyces lanuginosus]|uniref:uncharacterized protein n=1 Tax=Thermomyces lanuginosus TaxID=5541 RepID=UPI003743D2D7